MTFKHKKHTVKANMNVSSKLTDDESRELYVKKTLRNDKTALTIKHLP